MSGLRWYKGNLHAHTLKSDGDISPEKVARWYGRHGHNFLTLTDHDLLTLVEDSHRKGRFSIPLLIPGQEVLVQSLEAATEVHINAIGISKRVESIAAEKMIPATGYH